MVDESKLIKRKLYLTKIERLIMFTEIMLEDLKAYKEEIQVYPDSFGGYYWYSSPLRASLKRTTLEFYKRSVKLLKTRN